MTRTAVADHARPHADAGVQPRSGSAGLRLYPAVMGSQWPALPDAIKRAHLSSETQRGTFAISHGRTRLSRVVAWLLRCPHEAASAPVTLRIDHDGAGERWHRVFGRRRLTTTQRAAPGGLLDERIGPLVLRFQLECRDGVLHFRQVDARVAALAVAWPRWCRPRVDAEEAAEPGGVRVRVEVSLPRVGRLLTYDGHLDVPGRTP